MEKKTFVGLNAMFNNLLADREYTVTVMPYTPGGKLIETKNSSASVTTGMLLKTCVINTTV